MKRISLVTVGVLLAAFTGVLDGNAYVVSHGNSGPSYYGSPCLSGVCPPASMAPLMSMAPPVAMVPGAMAAGAMAPPMGPMRAMPKRISKCRPEPVVSCAPPMCQPQACGPALIPMCRPPIRWY